MAFDESKTKTYLNLNSEISAEKECLIVGIRSYDGGPPKVSISRSTSSRSYNLGWMSKKVAQELLAKLTEAVSSFDEVTAESAPKPLPEK